jgi:hypothetical protein
MSTTAEMQATAVDSKSRDIIISRNASKKESPATATTAGLQG